MRAYVTASPGFVLPGEDIDVLIVFQGNDASVWAAKNQERVMAFRETLTMEDLGRVLDFEEDGDGPLVDRLYTPSKRLFESGKEAVAWLQEPEPRSALEEIVERNLLASVMRKLIADPMSYVESLLDRDEVTIDCAHVRVTYEEAELVMRLRAEV